MRKKYTDYFDRIEKTYTTKAGATVHLIVVHDILGHIHYEAYEERYGAYFGSYDSPRRI